jgi:EAL domain
VLDVSINVSPVDPADPDFADSVERLLLATGANAAQVVLEITESGAMKDLANTLGMMERLRVLGIRFSIDDFGTGHSSPAHLRRLPADEIKIDRSFIQELESGAADDLIVRSTINLGHAMQLKVVAEGVEIPANWNALAAMNCDLIQGYFVAKPMPASQFAEWVFARGEAITSSSSAGRGFDRFYPSADLDGLLRFDQRAVRTRRPIRMMTRVAEVGLQGGGIGHQSHFGCRRTPSRIPARLQFAGELVECRRIRRRMYDDLDTGVVGRIGRAG